jgi:hypothetical protein
MSLIDSGPVADASCEGEAAGGEPEVEAVCAVEEGGCSRKRRAERTGRVSIDSGVSPSGRLRREGGRGVAWLGEVAIEQRDRENPHAKAKELID